MPVMCWYSASGDSRPSEWSFTRGLCEKNYVDVSLPSWSWRAECGQRRRRYRETRPREACSIPLIVLDCHLGTSGQRLARRLWPRKSHPVGVAAPSGYHDDCLSPPLDLDVDLTKCGASIKSMPSTVLIACTWTEGDGSVCLPRCGIPTGGIAL